MRSLLLCPRLEDLKLAVHLHRYGGVASDQSVIREAVAFFRGATGLVTLTLLSVTDNQEGAVGDMLEALASTGRSSLKVLRSESGTWLERCNAWSRLAAALPGLRSLTSLELELVDTQPPPPAFLRALTPASVPSLKLLRMRCTLSCPTERPLWLEQVDWTMVAYLMELRAVLARIPALHVSGLKKSCVKPCRRKGNCWTALGPPEFGSVRLEQAFSLYCHDNVIGQRCGMHFGDEPWVRLWPSIEEARYILKEGKSGRESGAKQRTFTNKGRIQKAKNRRM